MKEKEQNNLSSGFLTELIKKHPALARSFSVCLVAGMPLVALNACTDPNDPINNRPGESVIIIGNDGTRHKVNFPTPGSFPEATFPETDSIGEGFGP